MEQAEAAAALEALEALQAELGSIGNQLAASGGAVGSRHRFDRWKARTLETIVQRVNAEEASAFDKTYVPLSMAQGEYESLVESIQRHGTSLQVLMEEIQLRPGTYESSNRPYPESPHRLKAKR